MSRKKTPASSARCAAPRPSRTWCARFAGKRAPRGGAGGGEAVGGGGRVVGEGADPARDAARLETEFLVVDLDTVTKRLEKVARDQKKSHTPELEHEQAVLEKARAALAAETPLRAMKLAADEDHLLRGFMLLSAKPLLVVLNVGDDIAPELGRVPEKFGVAGVSRPPRVAVTEVCGEIEAELMELEPAEIPEFLLGYGLAESARDRVLHTVFRLLGFITFYNVSEPECRAWTAPAGTVAVDAAGMVHSDFARRFIKAEVIPWKELVESGGLAAARAEGGGGPGGEGDRGGAGGEEGKG